MTERLESALEAHGRDCADCGAAPPPVDRLRRMLDTGGVAVDAAMLSRLALARLAPELAARARALFWRRVGRALGLALLPLPVVLALDALLLTGLYGLAAAWLPSGVATYVVLSYAVQFLVLIGAAYAAIPLLVARAAPHIDTAAA
jgi:hypothetical protein